jgi:hypothetical protein
VAKIKPTKENPVLILRKHCTYYDKQGKSYPVPSLILLGNRKGFTWLSKFFARCAKKKPYSAPWINELDPDQHAHLNPSLAPILRKHSDEMEIRVGIITPKNKRKVFLKYSITPNKPYVGDLVKQYKEQIQHVLPQWKFVLRVDKEWENENTKSARPTD